MVIRVNINAMDTITENRDLSKLKQLQFKYKNTTVTTGNKCPVCRKKFSLRQYLLRHIKRCHRNVKSFKCRHCAVLFPNSQSLQRHIKAHEIPFNIKHICEYCLKSFKNICHLYQHLMLHIGGSGLCQNTIVDNNSYSTDTSVQNSNQKLDNKPNKKLNKKLVQKLDIKLDEKHICEVCSSPFATEANLKRHLKFYERNPPYTCINVLLSKKTKHICSICSRYFKNDHGLRTHLSVHSVKQSFSCKLCNVTYKRKYNLMIHNLKTHVVNKDKKFVCKFCSKSFLFPHELKYHLKKHVKDQSILESYLKKKELEDILVSNVKSSISSCDKNEKTNKVESLNDTELLNNTLEEKPFKVLQDKEESKTNIQHNDQSCLNVKGQENNDSLDSNQFEEESDFKDTKNSKETSTVENYSCNLCNKSFKCRSYLKRHQKTHTKKDLPTSDDEKYECRVCNKSFLYQRSLTRHLRKEHVEERDYPCYMCNKSFKLYNKLKIHRKIHLNNDSKTSHQEEDLNIIKVTEQNETNPIKDKNDIFKELNIQTQIHLNNDSKTSDQEDLNIIKVTEKNKTNSTKDKEFKIQTQIHLNNDSKTSDQEEDLNIIKVTEKNKTNSTKDKEFKIQTQIHLNNDSKTSDQEEDLNIIKVTEKNKTSPIKGKKDLFKEFKIQTQIHLNNDSKTSDQEEVLNIIKVTEKNKTSPIKDKKDLFKELKIQTQIHLNNDSKTSDQEEDLNIIKVTENNEIKPIKDNKDIFKELQIHGKVHLYNNSKTSDQEDLNIIKLTEKTNKTSPIKDKKDLVKELKIQTQIHLNNDSKTSDQEEDLNIIKVTEKNKTSPNKDKKDLVKEVKIHRKIHLNKDSKTSSDQEEDLKIINVRGKNKTSPIKDKKDIEQVNDMDIQIVEEHSSDESSIKFSTDFYQKNYQSFLNKDQYQEENKSMNKAKRLHTNPDKVYAIALTAFPKDLEHTKKNNHPKDRRNHGKNKNFEIEVLNDSEDNSQSFLNKCNEEENINCIKTKTKETYYIPTYMNENQVKENLNLKSANTGCLDSNHGDKEVTKTNVKESKTFSTEFLKDLEFQEDTFGNQTNKVSKIKEELCNDEEFGFNSMLEISNTEFIYDEALVNSAKRKRKNSLYIDLIQDVDSWNASDTQTELKVFNENNHITKLKLRYKLLKGKCTICNKIFNCPKEYVKHGLEFHPNPETLKSSQFSCRLCASSFPTCTDLDKHIIKHTAIDVKTYQEQRLEKTSSSVGTRLQKKSTFRNMKHVCKFCCKSFSLEYTLNIHLRVHTGDLLRVGYVCEVCDKYFKFNHDLKVHQRIHSNKVLKTPTDATPSTSTQFLIPTIKVNDIETCDSHQSLSKIYEQTNEKSFLSNEIIIKQEDEEFISFKNSDIKEEQIIVGD